LRDALDPVDSVHREQMFNDDRVTD